MYRTKDKTSGQRRSPPHLSIHQPAAPPTQAISPRFAIHLLPPWIWNQLSDINALEQFPRHIARGRRTEEIGDRQSNHTRYPENHGIHRDALIHGDIIWSSMSTVFDRNKSEAESARCVILDFFT